MIRINDLSYSFPQKDLFENISLSIEEGEHCAFIGTSGSGKSTLIQMIIDPEKYLYDGKLEKRENMRIGYVDQFSDLSEAKEKTVFEYVAEKFIDYQREIESLCIQMGEGNNLEKLMDEYQKVFDAYEAIGGDDYESMINKQLNLAKLSTQKNIKITEISGGEFKLVKIIKEMFNKPELLIMDEPDVFLDFENINSLKEIINTYKGTLLIITHNRFLLNSCFNKIIHLENKEIQEFEGSFIEYNFSLLDKKIELTELSVADDEEIERNEKIVEKQRFLSTIFTDAAWGNTLKARKKILERLEQRRIKAPFVDIKEPGIVFKAKDEYEDVTALKVSDYSVSFDELILENVNFEIKANEKVALVGGNGTGKTTLFKAIFNNKIDGIYINEDMKVSYLSQDESGELDESKTVKEQFIDIGFKTYDEVGQYLLEYGFEGEVLDQKIKDLSGGEKNLLQIAKISSENKPFLLLDEPTSHLDLYTQMALEKAIKNFNGSVLMVSHDYYSIINSVDYVLIIENKTIRKTTVKKFKRMIHANYFGRDYLELEEKKKNLEFEINKSLKNKDFEKAKLLSMDLEEIIKQLQSK